MFETKPLPETLKEPLFWHIDRFDSGEHARAAVGPASIALEAHGTWWLMTIATGSTPRRALAVVVYDSGQPPTTRMETGPQLVSCKQPD